MKRTILTAVISVAAAISTPAFSQATEQLMLTRQAIVQATTEYELLSAAQSGCDASAADCESMMRMAVERSRELNPNRTADQNNAFVGALVATAAKLSRNADIQKREQLAGAVATLASDFRGQDRDLLRTAAHSVVFEISTSGNIPDPALAIFASGN